MNAAFAFMRRVPSLAEFRIALGADWRVFGDESMAPWIVRSSSNDGLYLYVEPGGESLLSDMTPEELVALDDLDRGTNSLMVSYLNREFADSLLHAIANEWLVVINDDLGNMVPGEEFVRLEDMDK